MKKLLVAVLMLPTMAISQETKRIDLACVSLKQLVEVTNKYDELPLLRGTSVRNGVAQVLVMYANTETGSFTMVEKAADDRFCVLSVGGNFQPVPSDIIDEIVTERKKKRI